MLSTWTGNWKLDTRTIARSAGNAGSETVKSADRNVASEAIKDKAMKRLHASPQLRSYFSVWNIHKTQN